MSDIQQITPADGLQPPLTSIVRPQEEDIMTAIKAFIKRHPVPTYFALTFVISWGGILIGHGGPGGIPGTREQFERLLPVVILAMLAGPSVAGILLTGLVHGRAGFRELLSRLLRWRVGARWYAVALLTAPLLVTATPLALSLLSPVVSPRHIHYGRQGVPSAVRYRGGAGGGHLRGARLDGVRRAQAEAALRCPYHRAHRGLPVGSVALPCELLGKRRFLRSALPGPLAALAPLLCRGTAGLQGAHGVGLRPYREPARGDAHARESHSQHVILMPLAISGVPVLTWYLVLAAALWVVVAAVAVAKGGQLSRQPLQRRVA